MNSEIRKILEGVQNGRLSVDDALLKIKMEPFEDIGYAKIDLHRKSRQGAAEVVYGAGKTPEQISGILNVLRNHGDGPFLITRMSPDAAEFVKNRHPMDYFPDARIGVVGDVPAPDGLGTVVVATGGTSDLPVAEEAALTAQVLGNEVVRLYDVGVAGLIAVPTSVGYGASFHGLSALLSMLNSCASGVSVVNIDNGFGAGYLAGMINHMA